MRSKQAWTIACALTLVAAGPVIGEQEKSCTQLVQETKNPKTRKASVDQLQAKSSGEMCPEAAAALVDALADPDGDIAFQAASALGNAAGFGGAPFVAALRPLLPRILAAKDKAAAGGDPMLTMRAIGCQNTLRAFGKEALPHLIPDLKASARELRFGAANMIGNIGPDAKSAAPALQAALKVETDSLTKETIEKALARVSGPAK
jgi:HEAT repeat protein